MTGPSASEPCSSLSFDKSVVGVVRPGPRLGQSELPVLAACRLGDPGPVPSLSHLPVVGDVISEAAPGAFAHAAFCQLRAHQSGSSVLPCDPVGPWS